MSTQPAEHPSGGKVCGEVNPFYPDETCTKKAGHEHRGGKHDKMHHVRGTDRKWYTPGEQPKAQPTPSRDYNDMSEGEWQAFGQYGY